MRTLYISQLFLLYNLFSLSHMFAPTDLLLKNGDADVEIMLLGSKCDCDDARVVSTERGQMVSHLHILYLL